MMANVSDFLFQGSPPPLVNSNSTTTTQVPAYIQQYHQGILDKANAVAAEPYQTYGGQRIAKPTTELKKSWTTAMGASGSYKPMFADANASLDRAAGGNASGAAAPWIGTAGQSFGTAQGYANAGAGIDVQGAAQPMFNQAGQASYNTVNSYLSPYQTAVVDQIARKGAENLSNNLLPAMGDDFIRAGQLGSSRHMSAAGKAMSDTQQAVSDAQSAALNQGYQTALGAAQNDANRFLQLGQAQGNLADAQADNQFQAGTLTSNVAQGQAGLGQMAGNFNSIDTRNALDTAAGQTALGKATQSAGLTEAAAQEAVGRGKMAETQKNLDLAYQDWAGQRDYPRETLDWMATLTKGQPNMGGTVYSDSNAPLSGAQYGPSGLSQLAGGLSLASDLSNLFKAKGGYIDADEAVAPPRRRREPRGYADAPRRRPPPMKIPRRAARAMEYVG